jgi:hypothetical protein
MEVSGNHSKEENPMTKDEKQKLYTVRWYVRERWADANSQRDVLELLTELLDPESAPDVRPSVSAGGQHLLWCPFAETDFAPAVSRGSYATGYPKGAVVHFTAGRRNGLKPAMKYQTEQGYLYFVIDKDGNIGQNFPLDSWGYHAGKSSYPGLNGTVSDELVGIEIECAGLLTKEGSTYKTWYQTAVAEEEVRYIKTKTDNQQAGYYEKYTQEQEEALTRLLLWLHKNNPDVFSLDFVVGHDEVSPGRKNDPGGSLSMSMPKYREFLKQQAG